MDTLGASVIPATHLCLQGHFPGNPIVPGVVILDEAVQLIRSHVGGAVLVEIEAAKFHAPLLPDIPFQVRCAISPEHVRFECRSSEMLLVSGKMRLR